jgi:hypothetical protein
MTNEQIDKVVEYYNKFNNCECEETIPSLAVLIDIILLNKENK